VGAYSCKVLASAHVGGGGVVHAIGTPTQTPLAQLSPVVHALPSSQLAWSLNA
jgi:hypothetical protein